MLLPPRPRPSRSHAARGLVFTRVTRDGASGVSLCLALCFAFSCSDDEQPAPSVADASVSSSSDGDPTSESAFSSSVATSSGSADTTERSTGAPSTSDELSSAPSAETATLDASPSEIPEHDASAANDAGGAGDAGKQYDAGAPHFDEVQAVFEPAGCGRRRPGGGLATCHSADNAVGVIDLLGESAFDALVGAESTLYPGHVLVAPGHVDASFLMRKLLDELGDAGNLGEPMPLGEGIQWSPLPDSDLALVRAWIASGAPR